MTNKGRHFIYYPPGDKSISQRAAIIACFARGKTKIKNFSNCQDALTVLNCIEKIGARINKSIDTIEIEPCQEIRKTIVLNCNESATAMRLLAGALSGLRVNAILKAKKTLKNRSMKDLAIALKEIGAKVKLSHRFYQPVKIYPGKIKNTTFFQKEASAQIKSAIILAAIFSGQTIKLKQRYETRDHTERLLKVFKAPLETKNGFLVTSKRKPAGTVIEIPGDFSSAAYYLTAAVLCGKVVIKNVGLNPLRIGLLRILKKMGANIKVIVRKRSFEPQGEIHASYSDLKGIRIGKKEIISAIDELPLIVVAACSAKGKTEIKVLKSLRNKESDRIKASINLARSIGAKVIFKKETIRIIPCTLSGGKKIYFSQDHRITMAAEIASLVCSKPLKISDKESVKKSYPNFYNDLEKFKSCNGICINSHF